MVDADHGYGNALSVKRTVEELEASGVSALTIEDTVLPMSFGGGDRFISLEEGVGKMKAALSGRTDPNLVVAGRTSSLAEGLDECIRRVKAYEAAGVDAVFVAGATTREQVAAINSRTEHSDAAGRRRRRAFRQGVAGRERRARGTARTPFIPGVDQGGV